MIRGLGIDLCRVDRVAAVYRRFGVRFARKILTEAELELFERGGRKERFLAMRFAAKEACAKAFGTGFRHGVAPTRIGVAQDAVGKPGLYFLGEVADRAVRDGIVASHISMTDEGDYAAAVVVLETR
ncbi:MAG: holo-ACP synthase [Gammaproteobacteria bacterium]|nr:holo-ACP synthase [Gammaproteobacteria bacterium]